MRFAVSRHALVLALVLLYTTGFRLAVLNRPFGYDAEGASASQYGILARNIFGSNSSHRVVPYTHDALVTDQTAAKTSSEAIGDVVHAVRIRAPLKKSS